MIKTNIKMRVTPEQSKRVQEICFANGIHFYKYMTNKEIINANYLYIKDDLLTYGVFKETFMNSERQEIDADLFIKTNGTCEEKYKTEYFAKYVNHTNKDIMPKDYDDALKKISNLRIALNKKVEKNKNQALEITKLLEQKKDLQEINDSQNTYIKELENNLNCNKQHINQLESKIKIDTKWINHQKKVEENLNRIISDIGTEQRLEAIEHKKQLKEKDTIISYLESKLK